MPSTNPFVQLLPDISHKPPMVPADAFKNKGSLDKQALELFRKAGVTAEMLQHSIEADVKQAYDRFNIYSECARALEHWFVGPAMNLYANVATTYSPIHNSTVWITAENETYEKELNELLNRIGVEEKIFDWAFTTATYGDMYLKVNGVPGIGIVSIEDGMHPMNVSRVEYEGVLIGFYDTPGGSNPGAINSVDGKQSLIPPWDYVHCRLLGAKRKRPQQPGDSSGIEMRQIHMITGADTRQVTTRYGTSLIMDALPAYKRLRLAEDSLLLARVTRGIIKYIWKCKVDMSNMEAASSMIEQYATLITRARAIDTREGSPSYDSKQNAMSAVEDIFVPIWGDVGDLTYEKVGGEADIRWIVDIDGLRNQLAFALACSPSLGGAYTKEASGALGSEAITQLGIRFARSARRLQRALIGSIVRLCQIHLAYMGYDPDPALFEVHMSETSTAEEAEVQKSLETGMKSFSTFMKTIKSVVGKKADMLKVWEYWNNKILKMEDFRIEDFLKAPEVLEKEEQARKEMLAAKAAKEESEKSAEEEGKSTKEARINLGEPLPEISEVQIKEAIERRKNKLRADRKIVCGLDHASYLPILKKGFSKVNESNVLVNGEKLMEVRELPNSKSSNFLQERDAGSWEEKFSNTLIEHIDENGEEINQGV